MNLTDIIDRVTRLTTAGGLPSGVWLELCRIDSELRAFHNARKGTDIMSDERPSISELQSVDLKCRCNGEFSRVHNPSRGCPRHGDLFHDVVNRERILDYAPVLLEIAAAALEYEAARQEAARRREAYSRTWGDDLQLGVETADRHLLACSRRYDAALARVRP